MSTKITKIETFAKSWAGAVKITLDSGEEGWGQVSTFNADISCTVLHRLVAQHFLGEDPENLPRLLERAVENTYKFPGSFTKRAITGIDTAVWDLLGKRADKNVCALFGGTKSKIKAYGSSMRRDISPADEAARLVSLRDSHGYEAFKIRVGSVNGHDEDQWPGRTDELVPTVRKAVGDKVALHVDANSCYTSKKAIEVGRMLEDNGVCHFEEPCPYWEYDWTKEVTDALDLPVAGGEQDCFLHRWRRMIEMRAVDVVQPDICYIGGFDRAMGVAKMAEEAGLPCTPHSANHSLVVIFTLHMLGAIPNAGPYLEFSIEPNEEAQTMYDPYPVVKDGYIDIPQEPGWGIKIRESWLQDAEYLVSGTPNFS
jgi:L-alanine-DL-glutamate epimerase-like enolase superfamily enzyme